MLQNISAGTFGDLYFAASRFFAKGSASMLPVLKNIRTAHAARASR